MILPQIIFLLIGIFFIFFIFLICFIFMRKKQKIAPSNTMPIKKSTTILTSHDIKAVAGGDIMATQLDLARAYIELGKKNLAKKILLHVLQHGRENHQKEAERLMAHL